MKYQVCRMTGKRAWIEGKAYSYEELWEMLKEDMIDDTRIISKMNELETLL